VRRTLERSWKKDYKRDSSAVWRWAAVIAECEPGAQWPNPPTTRAAGKFLSCMKTFSGGESSFMSAIKKMVDGAVKASDDHGIMALYKSKFVQDNAPASKSYYPWSGEGDCLTWDKEKWAQFEFDEKLPGYMRCDTLPTYINIKKKTKKGKTKVTQSKQCNIANQRFDSACWSKTKGKIWSCGGCGHGTINKGFDGGCLFESHAQYKYASVYK